MDFPSLNGRLLPSARSLLPSLFPFGKFRGREFVVGDLAGNPGESLSINMETGAWKDFASSERGGSDLISLYAATKGLTQIEAARQLEQSIGATVVPAKSPRKPRQVVAPVPRGTPACSCDHWKHGEPSQVWDYWDAEGQLLGHVARYDSPGQGKEIIPWTFDGKKWGPGSWPSPRPLYGLDDLAARPDAPVLVCEGEKSVDAGRKVAPQYVVVTWPGGARAWQKADFSVLNDRRDVLLWPDADRPGIDAMWGIGHALLKVCGSVKIIIPDDHSDGWDAADALAEGWDWEKFKTWAKANCREITEGHALNPKTTPAASDSEKSFQLTPPDATAPPSQQGKWLAWGLDRSGNGLPVANLKNGVAVQLHDPSLKGHVWYDEFLQRILTGSPAREWTDADEINLTLHMQDHVGIQKIGRDVVGQAVIAIAFRDVRNCVKDWLESLEWDQEPRIDQFFADHFGAEGKGYSSEYINAASRNFWISMVARIYAPGCQVDNMIVLEGEQGIRKSSALREIGGKWFVEQHEAITGKGFYEVLQGKFLIEISELDAFSRTDVTKVKQVITCTNDRFRESYGRHAKDHPRQCIFVGTTNKDDWQRDETGARRFWPIACHGEIDLDAIRANRNQFFAEAVHKYKDGKTWWEMPAERTREEQAKRYTPPAWVEPIKRYIENEYVRDDDGKGEWIRRAKPLVETSISDILAYALDIPKGQWSKANQMQAAESLRHLGWNKKDKSIDGKTLKRWLSPLGGGNAD